MFNFSVDKRIIYGIVAIMIIKNVYQYATVEGAILGLVLSIPGVLIAITFHEFAHAIVAYKLGDDTPKKDGRLSLNPLDHLDPIGSLLLLFAGFGWGKPVQVTPRNYSRKISMEKGQALVSLAGPLMNFLLAIIFTIITCVVVNATQTKLFVFDSGIAMIASNQTTELAIKMLLYAVITNIGLGIFNLIPLPPLDGSKILMPLLPYKAKQFFIRNETIFYIAFVALWLTGLAGIIISPVIQWMSNGIMSIGLSMFGL